MQDGFFYGLGPPNHSIRRVVEFELLSRELRNNERNFSLVNVSEQNFSLANESERNPAAPT